MTTTRRRGQLSGFTSAVATGLAGLLLLTGCSDLGSDSGGDDSGGDGGAPAERTGVDAGDSALSGASTGQRAAEDAVAGAVPGRPSTVGNPGGLVTSTFEIKTGSVTLESAKVARVVDDVYALAAAVGGDIESEQTSTNAAGETTRSLVVLSVPVDTFEESMRQLSRLGTLRGLESSSDDVTTEVADVDTRVDNARESIAQLRRLFTRASKLGEIIALESEISERQADLESLLAQQRVLAEQTAMSQITVAVTRPDQRPAVADEDEDRAGFLSGLEQGWDAMVGFVFGLGRVVGAALPLAALLGLVALALWPVVRRFRPTWQRPTPSE